MDIKEKMQEVNYFLEGSRQMGHTAAVMVGAQATDGIVLAADLIDRNQLENKARIYHKRVSVKCVEELRNASHRPLLLDNKTVFSFFREAIGRIEELEAELKNKGDKDV